MEWILSCTFDSIPMFHTQAELSRHAGEKRDEFIKKNQRGDIIGQAVLLRFGKQNGKMTHCGVALCFSDSDTKHSIEPLDDPIIIDDAGSVLDGLDIKFFFLPSLPKGKGTNPESVQDMKEIIQTWIHRLGRGKNNLFNCCIMN